MRVFKSFIHRPGRARLTALSAVMVGLFLAASGATWAAEARLISDARSVAPGATFKIAIVPDLKPGQTLSLWAGGDSGGKMTWTLPDGFTLGRGNWPPVEKVGADGAERFQFVGGRPMVQEILAPEGPGSVGPLSLSVSF